jgi:hypothetical protein
VKRNLFALLSLLVLASMVLAACGGTTATEAPATDEPAAPAVTKPRLPRLQPPAPTAEPTPIPDVPIATFDGTSTLCLLRNVMALYWCSTSLLLQLI